MLANRKRFFQVLTGFLMMIGNSCWLCYTASLYYVYNYTKSYFNYILPAWVPILEVIIAATGIYIGLLIRKNRISVLKGSIIDLGLVASGILIFFLAVH